MQDEPRHENRADRADGAYQCGASGTNQPNGGRLGKYRQDGGKHGHAKRQFVDMQGLPQCAGMVGERELQQGGRAGDQHAQGGETDAADASDGMSCPGQVN